MSEKKSFAVKAAEYRVENVYVAKKVLQDPERYGDGMVIWARMVLTVPEATTKTPVPVHTQPEPDTYSQGRLF